MVPGLTCEEQDFTPDTFEPTVSKACSELPSFRCVKKDSCKKSLFDVRGFDDYKGFDYYDDQAQNDNTLELPSSTSHRDSEHTTLSVNVCLSRSLHRARGDVLISCLCCRVRSVTERTSSMFLLRSYLVHFVDGIAFYIIFLIFILS